METTFKPFCAQISRVKFISEPEDTNLLFCVGTCYEPTNSLTLMTYGSGYTEPTILFKSNHDGDVMDIQYNKRHDRILTSSSKGSINIYSVETTGDIKLELDVGWDKVCSGPITGVIFGDNRIIAASEDNSILGIRLDRVVNEPGDLFEIQIRDCCSVTAVESIDQNCFVSSNALGQLKLWDIRSPRNAQWTGCSQRSPSTLAVIHCLARHPGQPNIVASGGSNGIVCIWDLRQARQGGAGPVQLNTTGGRDGHGQDEGTDVWQVRFHPTRPHHLLVASSGAGLIDIHSVGRGITRRDVGTPAFDWGDDTDAGLASLKMQGVLAGTTVTMVTLDVSNDVVVAGSDKEMLCLLPIEC